jgi:Uma2 family endonuclease
MTARPLPPTHLLTIEEYLALGEDEHGRTELQEGSLVMSPSPTADHMVAIAELYSQLKSHVPEHLDVIPDVDIDLELVPSDQPGSSRRPDLIVAQRSARQRVRAEGGMIRASEVALVVEIVSKGSRRTDNVIKHAEYADAGIEDYWIIDLDRPASLQACHLTEQFGYVDDQVVTGTFKSNQPFEATLDLDNLV